MDAHHPPPTELEELYDRALPEVYGYLRGRCGSTMLAEELTSATFLQAVRTLADDDGRRIDIGWLITVARHRLVDHWRRQAVADRALRAMEDETAPDPGPWDAVLDRERAATVLAQLRPDHRSALTLRYLDDLSVPECAEVLDRSVHATESLLVRARGAFRRAYEQTEDPADAVGGHDVTTRRSS